MDDVRRSVLQRLGALPADHLAQHQAERVDIGARVGLEASALFGSHVGGRADDGRGWVMVSSVGVFAKPKSSTLTPIFVTMMLPGLRSRCTSRARSDRRTDRAPP